MEEFDFEIMLPLIEIDHNYDDIIDFCQELDILKIEYQQLHIQQLIAQGSASNVFLCKWENNFQSINCIVKEYKNNIKKYEILKEIQGLYYSQHQNVVKLLGIFLEYCDQNLYQVILQDEEPRNVDKIIFQILAVFDYLHSRNIYHGDIHPLNILCQIIQQNLNNSYYSGQNKDIKIKVADFRLCEIEILQQNLLHQILNSHKNYYYQVRYSSPEVFNGEYPSEYSDNWSIGLIIYFILTKNIPWKNLSISQIKERILQKDFGSMFESGWEQLIKNQDYIQIIQGLVNVNKNERSLIKQYKIFMSYQFEQYFTLRNRNLLSQQQIAQIYQIILEYFKNSKEITIQIFYEFNIEELCEFIVESQNQNLQSIKLFDQITDTSQKYFQSIFQCQNSQSLISNLKQIQMSNNNLASGIEYLSNAIDKWNLKNLSILEIESNNITDEGIDQLTNALIQVNCTSLQSLSLCNNQLTEKSVFNLESVINQCQHLLKLDLSDNYIDNVGVNHIMKNINQNSYQSYNFKILKLKQTLNKVDWQQLFYKDMYNFQSLAYFSIQNIEISNNLSGLYIDQMNFIINTEKISKLDQLIKDIILVNHPQNSENFDLFRLFNMIDNHNFHQIQWLSIKNANINDQQVSQIILMSSLQKLINLENLDLSNNCIGNEGLFNIGQFLNLLPNLIEISLYNNKVNIVGLQIFIKSLLKNESRKQIKIDLFKNQIDIQEGYKIVQRVDQKQWNIKL